VLESLLSLVEAGELRPTAQQVANHAGVALRTVYHHFEDVEALRNTALDLQVHRQHKVFEPIDSTKSAEERARLIARQSRKIFEAITPIRRAALPHENGTNELAEGLAETLRARRSQLAEVFARELARQPAPRDVLDAADAVSSWQSWYYLRAELGRSASAAERIVANALADLFSRGASRAR
jgi:TetR/AcrR family transcriptional regulator, regulator of autoinduction and epiphytic fitness